ncbi:MAG TPA: LysE family transporter [Bacilli bacterium]|nr:LysE family transporter [Bacilli bacterium]
MIVVFLHGFLLALGLILPLGVQNVFIFNQGAVQPRFMRALPAVAMATLCDALLITVAVLGLSVVVLSIGFVKYLLLTIGILFLLYMGFVTWRSAAQQSVGHNPTEADNSSTAPTGLPPKKQLLFAASVSLLNPHAILDTVGVIGTSSLQYGGSDKLWFTLACMLTSLLWFLTLASLGRLIGNINPKLLAPINRVSALIMWGSAVYLAVALV